MNPDEQSRESLRAVRGEYRTAAHLLYVLSALILAANLGRLVWVTPPETAPAWAFAVVTWLSYAFVYSLPVLVVLAVAAFAFTSRGDVARLRDRPWRTAGFAVVAVVVMTALQLAAHVDVFVYQGFRFHMNGFVWNLMTTPGGPESMDMDDASTWGVVRQIALLAAAQAALTACVLAATRLRRLHGRLFGSWRGHACLIGTVAAGLLISGAAYGAASLRYYRPILLAAEKMPFYVPMTFGKLGRRLGWEARRPVNVNFAAPKTGDLNYPLKPLAFRPEAPKYNIVFLMCESWRYDMLTEEIMPETWAFAQGSVRCVKHYSGGNNTRNGVFAALTGLYGGYWKTMLAQQWGSAFIHALVRRGYEIRLHSSQSFTYPEFDKTVFSAVGPEAFHVDHAGPTWTRDRRNVDSILQWLTTRSTDRPFFLFMFFESPHARYAFPPESVIRPDYCKDYDYSKDIGVEVSELRRRRIFNRYVNATHHLDGQLGRLTGFLADHGMLENTIVVIAGDHGEAFMEKDRWGHGGSTFYAEQVRTPLVVRIPGQAPATIDHLTSHHDLVPTVLTALGVDNPPGDYCLGENVLAETHAPYVVCFSWDCMAYVDERAKVVSSFSRVGATTIATCEDGPVEDELDVGRRVNPRLVAVLKDLSRFRR